MDFSNITTPEIYLETAFLAQEIAKEMLARLELMAIQPRQIVDLGCGIGLEAEMLAQRYPEAQVWGLDLAQSFLAHGKKQGRGELAWVLGDAHTLPFQNQAVDFIFANLLFPWAADPAVILREARRVLRPNGLLLFSCFGPDTFKQGLKIDAKILPHLVDMHPVGDALIKQGFADPVLEVEHLVLNYRSQKQALQELAGSGFCEPPVLSEFEDSEGKYALSFEVIYGHAWCPVTSGYQPDEQGVVRIPISGLKMKKS